MSGSKSALSDGKIPDSHFHRNCGKEFSIAEKFDVSGINSGFCIFRNGTFDIKSSGFLRSKRKTLFLKQHIRMAAHDPLETLSLCQLHRERFDLERHGGQFPGDDGRLPGTERQIESLALPFCGKEFNGISFFLRGTG